MITKNGKLVQITDKRFCKACGGYTDQVCYRIRYGAPGDSSGPLLKFLHWVCPTCRGENQEVREAPVPSEKAKIIGRLLRMQEDYGIQGMNIVSNHEKLTIEITFR